MGLLLDFAVVSIALVVTVSLGMLAWTLGVSAVLATRRGRSQVARRRARLPTDTQRFQEFAGHARRTLAQLAERTEAARNDR